MKWLSVALLAGSAAGLVACDGTDDAARIVGETSSDRVELTAEFNEPITELLVAEGDAVTAGQVLMRQDTSRAAARLAEAEAALKQAKARLDEMVRGPRSEQIEAARAAVDGARDELTFRRSDYARTLEIYEKNLTSGEALDRAKAALDAAVANDKLRRAQLQELLTGTTVEELAQAESLVEQAEARRNLLAVDLARHEIVAPVDGIADSRLFEVGERPNPGQAVMVLLAGEQVFARVYVPEQLRARVGPGTEATIVIDGIAEPIAGRFRWVASEAAFTPYYALTERDRGHLTYLAKVDIVEARERLPDGIPVEVSIPAAAD